MPGPLLCIGGVDPSGGAGLVADVRAARAVGADVLTVVAALTAQNSRQVVAVRKVPSGWVLKQIEALEKETTFAAIKTGLIADRATIADIARWYRRSRIAPLVVDPVMIAGDGTELLGAAARRALARQLVPLAALVTPNRLEAEILTGAPVEESRSSRERAARMIAHQGAAGVLLKGGHFRGDPRDLLWDARRGTMTWLPGFPRRTGRWHGLGCHLASAVAARLALGDSLIHAVSTARRLLERGMREGRVTRSGRKVPSWRRSP